MKLSHRMIVLLIQGHKANISKVMIKASLSECKTLVKAVFLLKQSCPTKSEFV